MKSILSPLYRLLLATYPSRYKKRLRQMMIYSGENIKLSEWFGPPYVLSIMLGIATLMIPWSFQLEFNYLYIIYSLIVFLGIHAISYFLLEFKVEDRTTRIEKVLPDMLQLISANIRSGMTPFQAIKLSSRKEFGPLKEELDHATTRALGTESFSKILLDISKKVNSAVLERALKLLTSAIRSGGKLAKILDETAKDIIETRNLKNELITNTRTYTMFIMFTVIIGTPLLLAISVQFLKTLIGIQGEAGLESTSIITTVSISPEFMVKVAIAILLITGTLASVLIGTIKEGKLSYGLRYAPLVSIGSLIIFFIARYGAGSFF